MLAIAGVLLCYGTTELVEGYGFTACFVTGVVLRRFEASHEFHGKLHSFNEAIELALTALLLVLIGGTFPLLFGELDLAHAGIVIGLLFIMRPFAPGGSAWSAPTCSRRTGLSSPSMAYAGSGRSTISPTPVYRP